MKKTVLYAAAISLFAAIAQAQNENVTWLAPANISGASDVNKQGTYLGTWAPYDGNANNLPVNGVHFEGNSDLPGMNVTFSNGGNDQNGYGGFNNPGTPNSNYNTLLQTATYCNSTNGTIVITWSDIPGHTYLIELWANDGRGVYPGRSETITGGANTSGNVDFGDAPGQYVIGTYMADSSGSETITVSGANNIVPPMVNLLLIRDITEGSVTWQTPASISKDSDVSTQGTYFGSWAPEDGSANSEPVNGVTFQGNSDLPGFSTTGYNSGYNAYPPSPSGSANYNALLAYGAYDYPGQPYATFSWGGMTPGHTYQVEIWDNTGNSGRTDTFSDSSGDSVNVNENGNYVIGTFVATNSEETITENGPFPNINLLQVRDLTAPPVVTNYQSSVLADNPLGYWPLNLTDTNAASGIATDLSGNGNNGSYDNISTGNLVAGPTPYIPNAASFNNADVNLGDPTLLDFGGPITLEAWVQPASTSVGGGPPADILGKGDDGSYNYDELVLRANGGYYYGGTYNGSDNGASAQGGQQTTNWTYVVATYDGANWNLYVNSQLVGQGADTVGALEWPDSWAIGNGTANGNNRLFQGNICQVALYNYSLTSAQVLAHYYEAEVNASPNTSAPIILTPPQPQGSYVGGSATFSVTAVSALPMTNQWYKGGVLLPGQTNTTLTVSNLPQGSVNYTVRVGNANGSTNATATLTVRVPNDLEWGANANDGNWNTTSLDWLDLLNSDQTNFNQGDQVLFDDTAGVLTSVAVNGTVFPSLITVNSSANNFSFSSGTIAGSGSLLKEGTSVLSIMSVGTFSGTATIGGGALYASNSLNSVSAITVSNGATLDFGGGTFSGSPKPITVSGTGLNGEGALYNSYGNDPGQVVNITLTGDTLFAGSARWDLNSGSEISGPYNLTLDWSGGAGYSQWNSITIGANVPQITLTNAGTLGMTGMDSSCQNTATILNIGTNDQLVCYSGGFNGGVTLYNGAQWTIYNGNLNLAGNNMHLYPGSTIYLYSSDIAMTGTNLTFETGSSLQTYYNGGNNPINNQVTLNGVAHWVLGDHTESFSNVVSGVGGFVLNYYNHEVVFSSSNTYSGPTVIGSDGESPEVALAGNGSISHSSLIFFGGSDPTVPHIDVSGRSDQTLTLTSGQTLAGVGGINGSLVVSPGATLSPSGTNTVITITSTSTNAVGAIAASANVTLGGTTVIKLDGSGSNDMVEAAASITYGGTLNLVNISGSPLAAGNSFQIFNAATYSGSFSGGITPATPGSGLAWNTSQLSSGVISVVSASQPVISGTGVSGGNLVFTVTGGNSGDTLYVLTRTNLLKGGWVTNATYQYGALGSLTVTNAINKGIPAQFFMIQGQ
jgi:Concanavalin A-like lectin/glucanases superfamily